MKKAKSLCKSCSNRVSIKYHGEDIRPGELKGECFYEFKVSVSDSRYPKHTNGAEKHDTHVSNVIVEECSFYNKYIFKLKKNNENDSDDTDDDINKDGSFKNGVTFTNIPGALLP